MDKERMIFDIDRSSVTEGEVVEIRWQCHGAEKVQLTIDNGLLATNIPLETSGSKRFRLNRSKGRTRLTICVTLNGKEYKKTHRVRVKKMPVLRAETLDHKGRPQNALRQWWQGVVTKWHNFRAKNKYRMQQLPESKQVAVKGLGILGLAMLLSAIWPQLYSVGMLLTAIYLSVVLLRR